MTSQLNRVHADPTGIAAYLTGDPAPASPAPTASVVYALAAGALIKIGTTTNLEERLRTLAASSPTPLTLLGTIPGGRPLEASLHRQFAAARRHGEWFELTAAERAALDARLAGEPYVIRLRRPPRRPRRR